MEADRLANAGADDLQRHVRKEAREVLEQAHRVRLERLFTDEERTRAEAYVADPRIGDALNSAADFGIAEYLAAGPDLCSDWENAWSANSEPDEPSAGAALVAAAIDVRCTGYGSAAPRALVERLHERYLDERGGSRLRPEPLDTAWAWATRPRRVTTALLQPVSDDGVEAFDYLVDVVQRRRPPDHHVAEVVVREALLECSAADADGVATVAQRQGRYALAEHAWRTAYELRVRHLGGDHVDTIAAQGRLAAAIRDAGRRTEAEAAFREVLAASMQVLGAGHPHTLLARSDLAFLLLDAGQFAQAEAELRDVLAECVRTLGPGQPQTLLTRSNLALLLIATRRPVTRRHAAVCGPKRPGRPRTVRSIGVGAAIGAEEPAVGLPACAPRAARGWCESRRVFGLGDPAQGRHRSGGQYLVGPTAIAGAGAAGV
ncbi:tetratricopeptide repeat protein [Dactylosporangium darangshiense]|uniref:tetratricopeptide repeat protein n=1 Tax=Dactylosporangium darangshiense TaxID=579108 RepID=UPI00364262AF